MKNSGKLVSFLVPIISILLAFVIGLALLAGFKLALMGRHTQAEKRLAAAARQAEVRP